MGAIRQWVRMILCSSCLMIHWEVTDAPHTLTRSLRIYDGVTGAEFESGLGVPPEWINNRVALRYIATAADS